MITVPPRWDSAERGSASRASSRGSSMSNTCVVGARDAASQRRLADWRGPVNSTIGARLMACRTSRSSSGRGSHRQSTLKYVHEAIIFKVKAQFHYV